MSDSVAFLPLSQIQPNPFQPRQRMQKDEINELVQSIKTYGILEPLVIAETPAGYQIIAGERRWRAAKEAGLEEVPVIIKTTTPRGMLEMALVENVQRVDLDAIERAKAFDQLIKDFKFTIGNLAERVGKSVPYISNTLRLLALPDAIKDGLIGGAISEGHARAIAGIEDEKAMIECYKLILKEGASVRRSEDLARRFKEASGQTLTPRTGSFAIPDEEVKKWQKQFQSHFHSKTKLAVSRSKNNTKVSFTLKGPPEETQADLDTLLSWSEIT
jgi:ParB family transcriptional regulator, chromosome partitioning protein